jgi:DNA (cytosine-5)-methyltransferase 1
MIKVGSDFSGVGAFNQALNRLSIDFEEVFACDMDKYARQTFIHNYGEPKYYPKNVYDREIPSDSLDIYMTSPPCQAFSLAGKRLGKDDKRGVLFFNSHEFIQENKPRFFIFENVKGLLSDDSGRTFQEWINHLGGKSVNSVPVIFPTDEAVPYHIYWKVLNAKKLGVPQNRERVFIIGIRDDEDNVFDWPQEVYLTTRLKDVLENEVDDKYFLSEKLKQWIVIHREKRQSSNPYPIFDDVISSPCITSHYGKCGAEDPYIAIKSGTAKGYEEATEGDSINFGFASSETRRGRVGKEVAQTLDTSCNQGVIIPLFQYGQGSRDGRMVYDKNGISPCMVTGMGSGGGVTPSVIVGTWRTHKDGQGFRETEDNNCPTIPARAREDGSGQAVISDGFKIRRLTPRECFRLMDFPDSFTWPVSDSQAYKQAGNSIVVKCLELIINNLKKL